jgi:hypothetical protein
MALQGMPLSRDSGTKNQLRVARRGRHGDSKY